MPHINCPPLQDSPQPQRQTLGITRRAFRADAAKLTMRGALIGGRAHAVVGRRLRYESFNQASAPSSRYVNVGSFTLNTSTQSDALRRRRRALGARAR